MSTTNGFVEYDNVINSIMSRDRDDLEKLLSKVIVLK